MAFHAQFCALKTRLLHQDLKSQRPIFLLTYGPVGCGKSTKSETLLKRHGYETREFAQILLDEIVESDPEYIRKVEEEMARTDSTTEGSRRQRLQSIYFDHRKDAGVLSEALMSLATRHKYHIISETTGSDQSVNWSTYMIRRMEEAGYQTWIFYPFVTKEKLIERVDKRAKENHRWIPHDIVAQSFEQARDNFPTVAALVDQVWLINNDNAGEPDQFDVLLHLDHSDNINSGRSTSVSRAVETFKTELGHELYSFVLSNRPAHSE